jgi:hypothetical protein
MRHVIRRSRGLLVAIAALALTATAAFAARPATAPPAAAADGLSRAAEAAGKTVPVSPTENAAAQAGTSQSLVVEAPASSAPDANADTAPPADPHRALVSAAAQTATPTGFDNHGAYVSQVALQNHGQTTAAAAKTDAAAAAATGAAAKAKPKPTH